MQFLRRTEQQKEMAEKTYSPHGGQEAERTKGGTRKETQVTPTVPHLFQHDPIC